MLALAEKLTTPVVKFGAVALVILFYTVWQREQAASKAREGCQAEQLSKTLAETRRQLLAAQEVIADTEKRVAADDMAAVRIEKERESINADAKPTEASPCGIPRAITDRLSNIK
jgi:hypothetical protein